MKALISRSSARLVRRHLSEFSERNELSAVFIPQCRGNATQAFADCDASLHAFARVCADISSLAIFQ